MKVLASITRDNDVPEARGELYWYAGGIYCHDILSGEHMDTGRRCNLDDVARTIEQDWGCGYDLQWTPRL